MINIANCLRPSLLGDIVVSIPFLTYLEKLYPQSYKMVFIDRKCQSIAPLLINHPLIDKIYVSEVADQLTQNEENYFKKFNLVFEPFPQIYFGNWWNEMNFIEATFRLNCLRNHGYVDPNQWHILTDDERFPRLYQWFDVPRQNKTIAIWTNAGYNTKKDLTSQQRSPNVAFWERLVINLNKIGYTINQYGTPNVEKIESTQNRLGLSLFEAVKESLGCDLVIGADSGSQHILGAYGHPQIILYTNWRHDHIKNFESMCPVNYNNNLIKIFGLNGINNINIEKVLDAVGLLNK